MLADGGAGFAPGLTQRGLGDEYRLLMHPVTLGNGRGLFAGLQRPAPLQWVSSTAFPGGVVAQVYTPRQA